jgi:hypothetical protein
MRLGAALAVLAMSSPALALEPWVDADPAGPPKRYQLGAIGVRADAEYRAQFIYVDPISLTTEDQRKYNVIEHRLRLGGTVDYQDKVSITTSLDVLDSVLWGDNGTLGGDPAADSGLKVTIRNPNIAKACMQPLPAGDPQSALGYGWGLCSTAPVKVRRLYAQVNTPIGAIRVGRQPVAIGMGVQNTDGEGRRNRFGVSYSGDSVDRILFATKPLEITKPSHRRNFDENQGLLLIGAYDRVSTSNPVTLFDDVNQGAVAMRYVLPELGKIGRDLELLAYYSHRWNTQYDTRINVVGGRAAVKLHKFHIGADVVGNLGTTKEVSTAYDKITGDGIIAQRVAQLGARAVARWDEKWFTGYFEFDYATGDADPGVRTPLTQFRFAEDTNVGLLMFKHILYFQSARAAAAAVNITRQLGAETFPAERIDTRGAFTDAMAIFPQVDFRPHESVLLRGGVLVAWAPARVVDPVRSLKVGVDRRLPSQSDGTSDPRSLVNFVGGKPGDFYGVELDGRIQWRFLDHFALDLEGAVLFPGNAFRDINGRATKSALVQGRTTFFF